MGGARAVVVSADSAVQQPAAAKLAEAGISVVSAVSGRECTEILERETADLVVLDLALPDYHGLDICRRIVNEAGCGVITVVGDSDLVEGIVSLELGADDFVGKPLDARLLAAKARALLRRLTPTPPTTPEEDLWSADGLELDLRRQLERVDGRTVSLGPIGSELLAVLMRDAGRVHSRKDLCMALWADATDAQHRLTMHINGLRRKLEDDPHHPTRIVTVRGIGYRLMDGERRTESRSIERERPQHLFRRQFAPTARRLVGHAG
ncbi:MAG: response regulator transcription factor [Armatimonadia bacterium]